MSLYYETATLLSSTDNPGGSLKSRVYNHPFLKSSPPQIYALITEASKWWPILKEVIDHAGILALEPKLTPILSLLLVHDLLISRKGIAAAEKHPLRVAVERHRARLKAELTKVRLRQKCTTLEQLKEKLEDDRNKTGSRRLQPRWVRVNPLKTILKDQLDSTFKGYIEKPLRDVQNAGPREKSVYVDEHVPDLLALPPGADFTTTPAYKNGDIILQDKASCFPAYLLLGSIKRERHLGDIIDACAAPGNKTTHLAALLSGASSHSLDTTVDSQPKIFAIERSKDRSKTLQDTVSKTGASNSVIVVPNRDFLTLDPNGSQFANVTAILLDPSCSGSGIIGREEMPILNLPEDPRKGSRNVKTDRSKPTANQKSSNKKRKQPYSPPTVSGSSENLAVPIDTGSPEMDPSRLQSLSNLQTHLLTHAFSFPKATHTTYSTCSLHWIENEGVVARVLDSTVAKERGWRVLRRNEQVKGMREWGFRGIEREGDEVEGKKRLTDEDTEACLRCWPDGHERTKSRDEDAEESTEGTMGFFVVGFVRDAEIGNGSSSQGVVVGRLPASEDVAGAVDEEEEWEGFVD